MSIVPMTEGALAVALAACALLAALWWNSRSRLRVHRSEWTALARGCPDVLWHLDLRTRRFTATDRVWDWAERPEGGVQALFEKRYQYIHPDDLPALRVRAQRLVSGESEVLDAEFRLTFPGRETRWFRVRAHYEGRRPPRALAGSWSDVTEAKALGAQLWNWANLDNLTGLPNRTNLLNRWAVEEGQRCLAFVNIDNFGALTEALGHGDGDELLVWMAKALKSLVRAEDTVARWSDHRFAVLVATAHQAPSLVERIHQTLSVSVKLSQGAWILSVTTGVIAFDIGSQDAASVVFQAEQALQQARRLGGGHSVAFTPALAMEATRRASLEKKLTLALDEGALRVVYQPQFSAHDRRLTGFEALARWTDAQWGTIPPSEFIPLAENLGLMARLGAWALKKACQFLASQPDWVNAGITMSVNVSVLQLKAPHFADEVEAIVKDCGLDPTSVELEVTETLLIDSFEEAIQSLGRLSLKGFRIALDDFGKGYSSLSYLKVLPLNTLKIDKAFIDDLSQRDLLGAIIQMGRILNLQLVAEGIEEEHQLAFLKDRGCHRVQGFLLSRPLEAEAARALRVAP